MIRRSFFCLFGQGAVVVSELILSIVFRGLVKKVLEGAGEG